jgi:hypothetical protein
MAGWYRVVKTIKGHKYVYEQQTFRQGGQVRTRNRYLGKAADDNPPSGQKGSVTTTPLFTSPTDFAGALASKFEASKWVGDAAAQVNPAQWVDDAAAQVAGGGKRKRSRRRKARPAVTTTRSTNPAGAPPSNPNTMKVITVKEYNQMEMRRYEKAWDEWEKNGGYNSRQIHPQQAFYGFYTRHGQFRETGYVAFNNRKAVWRGQKGRQ